MEILRYAVLALALCLFACDKPQTVENKSPEFFKGYFICNEGNFTYSNASLSFLSDDGTMYNQVFAKANQLVLGDVLQSANLINDKLYLVANFSGKIWVCNPNNAKQTDVITSLVSPRYIHQVDEFTAVISDFSDSLVSFLDLRTNGIFKVDIGGTSEQWIQHQGKLYTNSWSNDRRIHKIDIQTKAYEGSIEVPAQPKSLVLQGDNLWVLSQGDENEPASISAVDLTSFSLKNSYELPQGVGLNSLSWDEQENKLYFLASKNPLTAEGNGGLFSFDLNQRVFMGSPIVSRPNGALYYHHYFDKEARRHIICDAKDYLQDGVVSMFNDQGALLAQHRASIIPAHVLKFDSGL